MKFCHFVCLLMSIIAWHTQDGGDNDGDGDNN